MIMNGRININHKIYNIMKTIKIMMAAVVFAIVAMGAEQVSAQEYTKKEKKELARDMKKQQEALYKRSPKMARKTASEWEKEGWKSMNLPIEKQLEMTWERMAIMDPEGYPKYVTVTEQATGTNFSAAQMHAEDVAKVRIASNLCASVATLADVALANNETTEELTASISKAVENSKIIVSEKLGKVFTSASVYMKSGSTWTVRVIVLYDQRQAMKIAHDVILQELQNESEENRAQLESLIGIDKLREQYNQDFE